MAIQGALRGLLDEALATGNDRGLRAALVTAAAAGGAGAAAALALAVGEVVRGADPPVAALEALLDRWAAMTEQEAPAGAAEVILPCAAVASYGEAAVSRPDWFDDEVAKLRLAAGDPRRPVRRAVAGSLRRMLDADRPRTVAVLHGWIGEGDAAVAEVARAALEEGPA
jgi:hypothetical protein